MDSTLELGKWGRENGPSIKGRPHFQAVIKRLKVQKLYIWITLAGGVNGSCKEIIRDPFTEFKEDDAHVKADLAIIHSRNSFSAGHFRHRRW